MATALSFSSVKLSAALVGNARAASQPMRRSVASQIEYWATLGQIVEEHGLTVQEARFAIEQYEAASKRKRAEAQAQTEAQTQTQTQTQVGSMIEQMLAIEADGSLAGKVREAVADNRRRAPGANV